MWHENCQKLECFVTTTKTRASSFPLSCVAVEYETPAFVKTYKGGFDRDA